MGKAKQAEQAAERGDAGFPGVFRNSHEIDPTLTQLDTLGWNSHGKRASVERVFVPFFFPLPRGKERL